MNIIDPKFFHSQAQSTLVNSYRIERDNSIHVSRFIECALRGYKAMTSKPVTERVDLRSAINFSKGTATEEWYINNILASMQAKDLIEITWPRVVDGVMRQKEVIIKGKYYDAVGHIDAVITSKSEKLFRGAIKKSDFVEFPIEVKSTKGSLYKKIIKPKRVHMLQLMSYVYWGGYPYGLLVYIDRDKYAEFSDGFELINWKAFIIKPDPKIIEELKSRLARVEIGLKTKTPPPKDGSGPDDEICQWCSYRKDCWGMVKSSPMQGFRKNKKLE